MTTEANATPPTTPQTTPPVTTTTTAAPTVTIHTEYQFEPTGHASLDYALKYLGKQGIGPDHPAVVQAQQGNWAALDVLASERKLDAEVLGLGKAGYMELQSKQQQHTAAFTAELDKIAASAGVADWNAVKALVQANSNPEELKAINAVLSKGDTASKLLAAALVQRVAAIPATRDGKPATKPSASNSPAPTTALSAAEYAEKRTALQRKYGFKYTHTEEFAALTKQRTAAIRAGIR